MLMNFERLNGKTIIDSRNINKYEIPVTQIKSESGCVEDQRQTLKGLGLRGVNTSSELKCDKSIFGMLSKVVHLIDVKIK